MTNRASRARGQRIDLAELGRLRRWLTIHGYFQGTMATLLGINTLALAWLAIGWFADAQANTALVVIGILVLGGGVCALAIGCAWHLLAAANALAQADGSRSGEGRWLVLAGDHIGKQFIYQTCLLVSLLVMSSVAMRVVQHASMTT